METITLKNGRILEPASPELIQEGRDLAERGGFPVPLGGGARTSHNLDLLVDVLQYASEEEAIEESTGRDSNFYMGDWFNPKGRSDVTGDKLAGKNLHAATCGTAACLAGTAALMTLQPGERLLEAKIVDATAPITRYGYLFAPDAAEISSVQARARQQLGLTPDQSRALFLATSHRTPQLRKIASAITGYDLMWVDDAAVKVAVRRERDRLRKKAARAAQKASD